MNVKEEPVSSTNVEEEQQTVDESPEIANVIIKQQRTSPEQAPPPPSQAIEDFENDPEAGPSGLQTEQMRSTENDGRRLLRYENDSSDDDSADERAAMWRPQESYRFNRNDEDSGDTRFSNQSWRYDVTAANEPQVHLDIAPTVSNQSEEVIDLSENESVHSNAVISHNPSANAPRNLEVLTAPDLQLDWLSDSSSDNEIVCTIRPQTPDRSAALDFTQPNLNTLQAPNDLPAIDLTASDDEEATQPRVYCAGQPGCTRSQSGGERMRLLYENHHNRLANIYLRNRNANRSPNFHNEQRGDR